MQYTTIDKLVTIKITAKEIKRACVANNVLSTDIEPLARELREILDGLDGKLPSAVFVESVTALLQAWENKHKTCTGINVPQYHFRIVGDGSEERLVFVPRNEWAILVLQIAESLVKRNDAEVCLIDEGTL